MDNKLLLEEFEKITDELLAIVIDEDTDGIIKLIEEGLSKRDEIISKISPEDKTINSEIKARILQKDNQLGTKFAEIKLSISSNINNTVKEKSLSSKKKKAHRGYMNPSVQRDGYFIDNKK